MCEFLTALIEHIVVGGQIQLDLDGKSRNAELKTSPNIFRGNTPQGLRGMGHFSAFKAAAAPRPSAGPWVQWREGWGGPAR